MLDKIWDAHVVRDLGHGWSLLHVDRHLLHDLSGPLSLDALARRGLRVRNPDLAFATPDHAVSSQPGRTATTYPLGGKLAARLRAGCVGHGIRLFDVGAAEQGIVHVIAPELGLALPGATLICGDSHTCTNGGVGALSFGVGQSESMHALATQVLRMQRPKSMRVRIDGALGAGVTAKDMALHVLGVLSTSGAIGHVIEFGGEAVDALEIEGRLTLCNLAVEMGARSGFVPPDERTIAYLRGRRFAPAGADLDVAIACWRALPSDRHARFDKEVAIAAADIRPTVTWGTQPDQSIPIDGRVPDLASIPLEERAALRDVLGYMGLEPGQSIADAAVDWVFIGSCTNARLSDLRDAARVARGGRVAPGVRAWVVPGSGDVKRAAEAEGLDRVFVEAGFEWREPGCAMCVAANGESVPPGARCVSTSNRNFVGRQGPRARTHLASPATAAASALAGHIADPRGL